MERAVQVAWLICLVRVGACIVDSFSPLATTKCSSNESKARRSICLLRAVGRCRVAVLSPGGHSTRDVLDVSPTSSLQQAGCD